MTYNAKNSTIVFAFVAMMMAAPLSISNAFGDEIDANMDNTCGFDTSSLAGLDFGTFDPTDSESGNALEQEVQLTPVTDTSASARVQITVADWFGVGTRASGTLTMSSDIGAGIDVVLGSNTYSSISGATSGLNFQSDGNAVADAQELATAIRAADSTVNVSTSGTNVVTIENIIRGTAGNSVTLTGAVGVTASDTTLTTGDNTPQLIMDGETTKFDLNVGSTASDTYANKVAVVTLGSSQEVLGGTDPEQNIFIAMEIDPVTATFQNLPYDGPLTQEITITVETACDGTAP